MGWSVTDPVERCCFIQHTRRVAWSGSRCVQLRTARRTDQPYSDGMLMTIAIVLVVLWLLGVVTAPAVGSLIHVLLVLAIVVVLIRVIQGRRALGG